MERHAKKWPTINWDDLLRDIHFSVVPPDDRIKATALYDEIIEHWNAFKENMNELKNKIVIVKRASQKLLL